MHSTFMMVSGRANVFQHQGSLAVHLTRFKTVFKTFKLVLLDFI